LVLAPIIDTETAQSVGGIYIVPHRTAVGAASLLPAVQSLAAQISSTLHSAQIYAQTLEHQKVEQELALAGEIQASFLPGTLPDILGWELAVTLEPARQTSGDFYDVIPLPNDRLGILIADVADKGTGAALFMALSRTLIRTYAVEHHTRPDYALRVANNRILADTQADLFVTIFYGVLDPRTGTLTYCNGGHNPPLLLKAHHGEQVHTLTRTGLPLGLFWGGTWEQKTVQIDVGDVLVLYTDGVTEAQDRTEQFFGKQRMLTVIRAHEAGSAQEIQTALMQEIHRFVGDAPHALRDDIALIVLIRKA
jgi:serine phosphatase RsbU (regulator of sigma subunit)